MNRKETLKWIPRPLFLQIVSDRDRERKKQEKKRLKEPQHTVALKVYRRPKGDRSKQYVVRTIDVPAEGRERCQ